MDDPDLLTSWMGDAILGGTSYLFIYAETHTNVTVCVIQCPFQQLNNIIQFQTTVRVIHSNFKVSRRSLSYVSLLNNLNSNLMSLTEHVNFILLSSETRYKIQLYDLQFHIVVELIINPLKLKKNNIQFLKHRCTMSKAALHSELGWEPINDFLNRTLLYIPNNRLCITVFDEMHAHSFRSCTSALKTVFESVRLAYLYDVNDFSKEMFSVFMVQFSSTTLRTDDNWFFFCV